MDREHLKEVGERIFVEPAVRAGARAVARYVPVKALLRMGLRPRSSAMAIAAPIGVAFVVGAAVGAGAILFFAPGSAELRRTIGARIDAARARIRDEEEDLQTRTAKARARAAAFASATHSESEDDHKNDHDDHGRPRRRSMPRA